jgi:molybdate transport system ATP-binding protein
MTAMFEAEFAKRFPDGPLIEANMSFRADDFGVVVLFGPSGSGKTTVLRCLAGLERPDAGRIVLGRVQWFAREQGICLPPQRRDVGFLSQDFALFPHLTALENIAYGLRRLSPKAQAEQTTPLVHMLSLAGLEDRYPRQLSGGEQQRVALARAVVRRPRLLLLDEPLSALDAPTREQLRRVLHGWLAQMGVPTIVVTHDLTEALTLADTLVVMDKGRMCQTGPADDVVAHPASLAVARIVGVDTIAPGMIVSAANGCATVRVGGAELSARAGNVTAGEVFVCIRAEDVQLAVDADGAGAADNKLPGVVREVSRDGHQFRVALDCGFDLTAAISAQAAGRLQIRPGAPAVALVNAAEVHLVQERGVVNSVAGAGG